MNRQDYYAHAIKQQIGYSELCAIGARHFLTLNEGDHRMGGLQFLAEYFNKFGVNVTVELNYGDLYDVTLTAAKGNELIGQYKDIYNDQLREIVVDNIEAYWVEKVGGLLFGTHAEAIGATNDAQ